MIQYVGGGLIYREDGSLFAQRGCWRDGLSVEEAKVRAPPGLMGSGRHEPGLERGAREAAQTAQPGRLPRFGPGRSGPRSRA